jgi:RimJ/RimL family protein N-acetyltransferase
MRIETQNIVIRAFTREDAESLYAIVRDSDIYRFMPDWTDNFTNAHDYYRLIDWFDKQQDNADVSCGRRYAIALPDTDEMIGMVGLGSLSRQYHCLPTLPETPFPPSVRL